MDSLFADDSRMVISSSSTSQLTLGNSIVILSFYTTTADWVFINFWDSTSLWVNVNFVRVNETGINSKLQNNRGA